MAGIPGVKTTNVVLVHGGFVDGSGWEGVYNILTKDGYSPCPGRASASDTAAAGRLSVARQGEVPRIVAGDVDNARAAFMADSQVPWGVDALSGMISEPAWKTKPSWYLIATDDKMIPPAAQRFMSMRAGSTVVEVAGSHAVYVSQPQAVAALIEKAARGVKEAANRACRKGESI